MGINGGMAERVVEKMRASQRIILTVAVYGMSEEELAPAVASLAPQCEVRQTARVPRDLRAAASYEIIYDGEPINRLHFVDGKLAHAEEFVSDIPPLGGAFDFCDIFLQTSRPIVVPVHSAADHARLRAAFSAHLDAVGISATLIDRRSYPHDFYEATEEWGEAVILASRREIRVGRQVEVVGDENITMYGVYSPDGTSIDCCVVRGPSLGTSRKRGLPDGGRRRFMMAPNNVDFDVLKEAKIRFDKLRPGLEAALGQ